MTFYGEHSLELRDGMCDDESEVWVMRSTEPPVQCSQCNVGLQYLTGEFCESEFITEYWECEHCGHQRSDIDD